MTRIIGTPPPPGAIVPVKLFDELRSFPKTDTGNAEAFQRLYGGIACGTTILESGGWFGTACTGFPTPTT
jgi:hypothetical protein